MRTIDFLLLIPGSLTTGLFIFLYLTERKKFKMQSNAMQTMRHSHNKQMEFKAKEILKLQEFIGDYNRQIHQLLKENSK